MTQQPLDLDPIRRRCEHPDLTPQPWRLEYESCDCGDGYGCRHPDYPEAVTTPQPLPSFVETATRTGKPLGPYAYRRDEMADFTAADWELMVNARQDVPALLARVAELETELAQAHAATETNREVARVLLDELAAYRPTP